MTKAGHSMCFLTFGQSTNGAGIILSQCNSYAPCTWWQNLNKTPHTLIFHTEIGFNFFHSLFQAGVQEGCHQVTAADFPTFLYDKDQYKLNPEDPCSGLFQGHVLLHGYCHIFTGPASWEDGKGKGGKQARAIVNKLKAPMPQTIAYAAIMVWFLTLYNPY